MKIIRPYKNVKNVLICSIITSFFLMSSIMTLGLQTDQSSKDSTQLITSLSAIPEAFDLRDFDGNNFVTSVKSQSGGTCWTHGVMAAMESNLLMTETWAMVGETGEPNLAEYHLDWWNGFNKFYNTDVTIPGGLDVHNGGDYLVSAAYLARGDGAVRDIDGQSFGVAPEFSNPDYHYYYPRHIEWYTVGDELENIDVIKQTLMTDGAIGTCVKAFVLDSNYTHYYDRSEPPNHAVTIVGWDDAKVTQAREPGAWLIKNSWGENWGLSGYLWISYYDVHAGHDPEMGAVSFQEVEPMPYAYVYYHDFHGWRDTKTECTEAFNKFVAQSDHTIAGVSFYTAANDVDYTITVYDTFSEQSLSEELASVSGTFAYRGFHTVDLSDPISVSQGDDFYLYTSLSDGGHAFDRTSEVPVLLGSTLLGTTVESAAHPDESYYRTNGGVWQDLYDIDPSANFCLKALVPKSADLSAVGTIQFTEVSPGSEIQGIITIENIGESFSKLTWDVTEYPEWGSWEIQTNPDSNGLLPEMGERELQVIVQVPDETQQTFTGQIKIVNRYDASDYELIDVSVATPKEKDTIVSGRLLQEYLPDYLIQILKLLNERFL